MMTGAGMRTFTEEFKREAVRLVESSGRTIGQVADDDLRPENCSKFG